LADLAAARGAAHPASAELDAGRLAQVLGNVVANASEHGVGPVEVGSRWGERGLSLEILNRDGPRERGGVRADRQGRGRGLAIAARAARRLGGRLEVRRAGGVTRTLVELPPEAAAVLERAGPADPEPGEGERDRPARAA
jgi:signal transduction histidine kinase